jgi:DNA polymerase III subunit epsilon
MREIILDTETTGLSPGEGHRIIEIGCVELINHIPSGQVFHRYINPERPVPKEAEVIHGLSDKFLSDKPLFKSVAPEFLAFIGDAPLVIHNADFDMQFLNAELSYLGLGTFPPERAIDTVRMARKKHPMAPASLDALCKRYGIDNSKREKHGALLDAELLAEVYLELIGGRQTALILAGPSSRKAQRDGPKGAARQRPIPLPPRLTDEEMQAHAILVKILGEKTLWPSS